MGQTRSSTSDDAEVRAPSNIPRRGQQNHHSGLYMLLGILLLAFSLLIITLQTQTNEAYINGTPQKDEAVEAQWAIWLQIPKLIFGSNVPGDPITSKDITGVTLGQGIELIYIITVTARKVVVYSSQKMEKIVGHITVVLIVLNCIFDFYTDAAYGIATFQAHIMFAVFCTFLVGFGPTLSLTLIGHGYKRI